MKKKKSPRLIALAMALVMLLPMMTGIPVFAAEVMAQSTTPTYFEDFTNVTDGKDLYYVGSTALPSSDLIVNDPTNSGKGKVWQMNVADHVDLGKNPSKELLDWFWITENTWSTKFVYEFDFYVEQGAVGLIGMDSQILNDGTNDASGYVWQGIYGLDLTNGQILASAKNSGSTVTSVTNDASFEQGKWYTLSLAMDIETCAYSLYLDGYKLFDAQMPVRNLWGNVFFQLATAGSSGTVYIDNMSAYAGTEPTDAKEGKRPYFEDFTGITDGKDLYYVGSTALPSSDLIVNDPTNSGMGKVWQMNVADHVDLNKNPAKKLLDWFWITENTWSTKFIYEFDFFVEQGAVGLIGMDSQVALDGKANQYPDVWNGIYGLDLTNGQVVASAANGGSTVTNVVNNASFEQGKWYTLSLAMDIETCAYSLYLDGYKLMDAQMSVQNLWGNILYQKANTGSSGTVYIDNMSVYAGTLPRNVKTDTRFLPIVSESQDYEADGATVIGQNASIKDVNGNKVAYIPHAYNNSIFGAQSNAYNYNQSSGVVVLRADYYIDASAEEQIGICSQIMTADGTTANGQTTTHWNALWNLWRAPDEDVRYKPGHARLLIGGRDVKAYTFDGDADTQIYVPCNKWVNITCVLDMIHAKLTVYVDGVAHATSTFGSTFTGNISFSENMWIAAKYSSSEGETFCYVDNTAIFDGSDTDIAQEKQLELDEDKSLLYIDATVGNKSYRTLSPKYFALAGETFSATPVYFNENGEYDSVVSMLHKVSIRYGNGTPENPAGMRFATQLDTDLLAELQDMVAAGIIKSVSIGTLIAPEDYLTEGKTLADLKTVINLNNTIGKYYDMGDGNTYFVGAIANLKVGNYSRDFAAAGYVKVVLRSGDTAIILADYYCDNAVAAAGRVLDQCPTLSNAQRTILNNYVNGISNGTSELEKLYNLNVLAIGDSFFGGHVLGRENQWLAILARKYNWNFTNLGTDGWLVADNAASARPSMSVQVRTNPLFAYGSESFYNYGDTASKTAEDVDVIFVEGGYNDYGWNTPLGTLDSTDDTTFYGALNLMISALLEQYPNATIILHTSWHLNGTKTIAGETVNQMDYLANAMKNIRNFTYANNDRVVLIDAGDPNLTGVYMADAEWRAEYACTPDDTAHLNQKGMELMADSMDNLMVKALYGTKPTRVLCVGDSITAGGYWQNNMQGYLDKSYDVYGLGVSGTTGLWNGVDLGFDPSGEPYSYVSKPEYELSKRYSADVVVIMLGTNDTKPENYEKITADGGTQFIADMTAMVESYQNLANSPKVFLALPATIYRDPASGSMSNVNLEELIIPCLETVAAATGASLIDVHGATADSAEHFSDGVHPSDDTGRALIAEAVADAILKA